MKVTLENLTKAFGSFRAVDQFNATLEDGELVSLLGPSGCGKSTILNMLAGILPVTSGKIYFDGEDVTNVPPEKRGIGLVFQNYALYPHMTVLQNICFPLEIKKVPKAARIAKARELAELVRIPDLLSRKPGELSGGQQQRAAIARALATEPDILCFDEPTSALDPALTGEVLRVILGLKEQKRTMVIVTHEMEFAAAVADKILFLADGAVEEFGTPESVLAYPNSPKTKAFLSGIFERM